MGVTIRYGTIYALAEPESKQVGVSKIKARGENNHNAVLTEEQVLAVYADQSRGSSAKYGVPADQAFKIRHGISWGWLTSHINKGE